MSSSLKAPAPTEKNQKQNQNILKTISNKLGQGAPLLLAFYLLVFCNFTADLIGPQLREVLKNNDIAKHAMGMFLMFFLITLVNPDMSDLSLLWALVTSIVVYFWFFLSTKCNIYVTLCVIAFLIVAYICANRARVTSDQKQKNTLTWVQDSFSIAAILISICGCIYSVVKGQASLSLSTGPPQ